MYLQLYTEEFQIIIDTDDDDSRSRVISKLDTEDCLSGKVMLTDLYNRKASVLSMRYIEVCIYHKLAVSIIMMIHMSSLG